MAGGTVASCVHLVKRRSRTPRCPRSAKRPIALCPKIVSSRPLPPGGGRLIWAFDPCRSTRGGCRQIEASLCQEASGGASKQRRGRGRSRGARVRERLVPKCRCSGFSRPRWIEESSLVVLPGPLSAAAEVDLELAPDGVADATLQGAQRLFLRLPFGDLALVVDPARCVVADLGDGGQVKGVVPPGVAARG